MSDDQRVEAAKVAILDRLGSRVDFLLRRPLAARLAKSSIAAADAADREAGIHRVRVDDATVEKVARTIWRAQGFPDSMATGRALEKFRDAARAVLDALTGADQ